MLFSILCEVVILIILYLAIKNGKLGFLGNVLLYAVASTIMSIFTSGFSFIGLIVGFIVYFVLGFILVFILNKIEDYDSMWIFVVVGLIIEFIIGLLVSFLFSIMGIG